MYRLSGVWRAVALPAVLLVVLTSGACRQKAPDTVIERTTVIPGAPGVPGGPAAEGSGGTQAGGAATGGPGGGGSAGAGAGSTSGTAFRNPDLAGPDNKVPLTASIAPSCAAHGSTVTLTLKSGAGYATSVRVLFPSGETSRTDGKTKGDGTFSWRVPVAEGAGAGEARFLGTAQDTATGRGSSGTWNFRVAAPGAC